MGIKKYDMKCDYCGKDFLVSSTVYRRLQDGRQKNCYCSIECKSKAARNGTFIKCDNCGKIFYRRQYHIDKQENGNSFCSLDCQFEYKHKMANENRKCEICGSIFNCYKNSSQRFCSDKCQAEWQKTLVGELSSHYRRVKHNCDYCGKEFMVKLSKENSGSHLFCSVNCRTSWYKNVFSRQDDQIEIHRKCALDNLKNQKYSSINSKPQRIVDDILNKNNINFTREYQTKYYSIDNYLDDYNLMIEVMGDFWHCNPVIYDHNNIKYDIHKDAIRKDKAKHTYILNKYGINILYLWESDLCKNRTMCENMIFEYIRENGKLQNYHSFNYGKKKEDYINIGY